MRSVRVRQFAIVLSTILCTGLSLLPSDVPGGRRNAIPEDGYSLLDIEGAVAERRGEARRRVLRSSGDFTDDLLTDLVDLFFITPESVGVDNRVRSGLWYVAATATVVETFLNRISEEELVNFINFAGTQIQMGRRSVGGGEALGFCVTLWNGRSYLLLRKFARDGLAEVYSKIRSAIRNKKAVDVDLSQLAEKIKARGGGARVTDGPWNTSVSSGDVSLELNFSESGREGFVKLEAVFSGRGSMNGWSLRTLMYIPCGNSEGMTWVDVICEVLRAPAAAEETIVRMVREKFGGRSTENNPLETAFAVEKRELRAFSFVLALLLFAFT